MNRISIVLLSVTALVFLGCSGNNRENVTHNYQGKIEVYKYGDMSLHSYTPAREKMPDISFIIEGKDGLVVLEQPSFPDGIKEFKDYLSTLDKPLVKVISSYHTNNLNEWEPSLIVTIEGMSEFAKSRSDGDANKLVPANTSTIPANSKQTWAGVDFQFIPALPTSAFPAADVIIAGKVFYMHGAPAVSHIRGVRNKEWIDRQLAYLENVKNSGCELIIGSHGAAARSDVLDFQVAYLEKVKGVMNTAKSKEDFISDMKDSFYGLTGEANLTATAENLYKE